MSSQQPENDCPSASSRPCALQPSRPESAVLTYAVLSPVSARPCCRWRAASACPPRHTIHPQTLLYYLAASSCQPDPAACGALHPLAPNTRTGPPAPRPQPSDLPQVARYIYLPPDVDRFASPRPSLLEQGRDEPHAGGLLAAVGDTLAAVHAATFGALQVRWCWRPPDCAHPDRWPAEASLSWACLLQPAHDELAHRASPCCIARPTLRASATPVAGRKCPPSVQGRH